MNYKVIVLPGAKDEFLKIHEYLKGRFGRKAAAHFKASYIKIIKALRYSPRMYEMVPDRPGVHKCASLSPTLILYEVFEKENRVEILTLYDGRTERA